MRYLELTLYRWIISEDCLVLGGWILDRVPSARIREFCGVTKAVEKRIDEDVFRWFGHVDKDRIANRVYVGECASSRSMGRPWKRWIDTMKESVR